MLLDIERDLGYSISYRMLGKEKFSEIVMYERHIVWGCE